MRASAEDVLIVQGILPRYDEDVLIVQGILPRYDGICVMQA